MLCLLLVLVLAIVLRGESALQLGKDWYAPGSFTLVNFDEAGSCRAALGAFDYSSFVGLQTLSIAAAQGLAVPADAHGNYRKSKALCHGEIHLRTARLYSALLGGLTAGVLVLLGWQLFPAQPYLGLLAGALLALCGWHMAESHSATVDAPSTFFIYSFFAAGLWAVRAEPGLRRYLRWTLAALLLVAAIWCKYWVFALLALAVLIPLPLYGPFLEGISRSRGLTLLVAYAALFGLLSNPALAPWLRWCLPLLFYFLPPWRRLRVPGRSLLLLLPWLAPLAMQADLFVAFSSGGLLGRFGTDYGAIGWHKPLRNALNLPLVLLMGLGLPGFVLMLLGLRELWARVGVDGPGLAANGEVRPLGESGGVSFSIDRAWVVLLPLPAFALYMLFLAPVTYYRHYLPLLPAACLLAALGFTLGLRAAGPGVRTTILVVLLLWQSVLAWDLLTDYHRDPRRALVDWYASEQPGSVLASYYVNTPPATRARQGLFRVDDAQGPAQRLRRADYLILSENWYDTAFANELNGPLVGRPERLIKTTAQAVDFYRQALSGQHPLLEEVARFSAPTFMPELILHKRIYGSFTQLVGDIVIFRVRDES
ncbi:MAG: hypothetical protein ACI87W_001924 [Halieaceae bacterium]|jgi:hypothetical protein